jgi:hypothetical protein
MPVRNRSALVASAVMAAAAGSAIGALAGAWSGYRAASTPATTAAPIATAKPVDVSPPATSAAPVPVIKPVDVSPRAAIRPPSTPKPPIAAAAPDLLERAGELARRADVTALVALRDSVARRARERGEQDSAATKERLDALDRYLGEARLLRLKIDGEELRKSVPAPPGDKPPVARR